MIEWFVELKDNIDRHGIRWGLFFTLYAVYRKEKRNVRLDHRDIAMFHNQRIIMEELGRGDEWQSYLPENGLKNIYPTLLKYSTKLKEKRTRTMDLKNINYVTLIPTLLAATKIILQPMGIVIPDEGVNEIVNGVASLGTAIGIFLPHTKAAQVSDKIVKAIPEVKKSFQEAIPFLTGIRDDVNKFLDDVRKDDGSQAFQLAMQAFAEIEPILKSYKIPDPVAVIQVSA